MSETLGEFQIRVGKTPIGAGVDAEVLRGYINDTIERICRSRPWTRLDKQSTLQTIAAYRAGTVSIAVGATAGTGSSTVFTSAMTGRLIRIVNLLEFYTFTYVSATSFTIDRPYEGAVDAVGATFIIWQPIVELPSDVAEIKSLRNPDLGIDMNERPREWLDRNAASRLLIDSPRLYVPAEDSANKLAQIELYPGPLDAMGLPMEYRAKPPRFASTDDTDVEFPDWISIPAVYAGVMAALYDDDGNNAQSIAWEQKFGARVMEMAGEDARKMPVSETRIADRYARHRVMRTMRSRGMATFRNWNGWEN
jgi:hypothetical protein